MEAIRMTNLVKTYGSGPTEVRAIKDVSLYVNPGEVVGLLGPSGSGKTTLLQCLGAVIDPTAGRIELNGETVYDDGWKIDDIRALRRDKIGFVFQAAYLIPFLSVLDNVALLPMLALPSGRMAATAPTLSPLGICRASAAVTQLLTVTFACLAFASSRT